jgi:hypothetical protein
LLEVHSQHYEDLEASWRSVLPFATNLFEGAEQTTNVR